MLCPYCQHAGTKVTDKRNLSGSIRRRRECLKCEKRFTTYENPEIIDLFVIKRSGLKEDFNREKLKSSFMKACSKRPIAEEQINSYVAKIEQTLRKQGTINISSQIIGDLVLKHLKKTDEVAYLRFASVYKQFNDAKDFKKELREVG